MDKQKSKPEVAAPPAQNPLARDLELIAKGEHSDPFGILGPHWIGEPGKKISGDSIFSPGRGAGCGDLGKAGGDLSCSADSSGWRIRSAAARGQNQRDRGSTGQTRFLSPAVDVS